MNDFEETRNDFETFDFFLFFQRRIRSKDFSEKKKFRSEIEMNERSMTFLKRMKNRGTAENRYLEVGK